MDTYFEFGVLAQRPEKPCRRGVTIMKDATAANSEEEQNHAEEKIFPLLGQTLSVDQFLEQLEE